MKREKLFATFGGMVACCGGKAKNTHFGRIHRPDMRKLFPDTPKFPTCFRKGYAASFRFQNLRDKCRARVYSFRAPHSAQNLALGVRRGFPHAAHGLP
jgi:hypothetical protein